MSENFDNMKQKMLEENERSFGDEIRKNYGEEVFQSSNNILAGLTEARWQTAELLRQRAEMILRELAPNGDPASARAQEMAELHGAWASTFWDGEAYNPETHLALAKMYTEDPRFADYYNAIAPGGAAFMRRAIEIYCDPNKRAAQGDTVRKALNEE